MRTRILFGLMLVAFLLNLSFQSPQKGSLKISVTNIKNENGEIDFNLFNKANGFPDASTKVFKHLRGEIINGSSTVIFDDIPYGHYAVSIYHDENNNRKMDDTWYGMPAEGVGVSNNPKVGVFSAPTFEAAKFEFDAYKNSHTIRIKYL